MKRLADAVTHDDATWCCSVVFTNNPFVKKQQQKTT